MEGALPQSTIHLTPPCPLHSTLLNLLLATLLLARLLFNFLARLTRLRWFRLAIILGLDVNLPRRIPRVPLSTLNLHPLPPLRMTRQLPREYHVALGGEEEHGAAKHE